MLTTWKRNWGYLMKIKYSPDARDRLKTIKSDYSIKLASVITKSIRMLSDNPRLGPSVENMLGISSPYFFLHTNGYYVFYRLEPEYIFITDIFSEREDFMWKLFGIRLRTQESFDCWDE